MALRRLYNRVQQYSRYVYFLLNLELSSKSVNHVSPETL